MDNSDLNCGDFATDEANCFHCGEAVPPGFDLTLAIDGRARPMCCRGCHAASAAILGLGLGDYYRFRDAPATRADAAADAAHWDVYDDPALVARYVERDGDTARATLVVNGMTCTACAWLLEQRMAALGGVSAFEIDYATRRAQARFDPARLGLAQLFRAVAELGFEARPFTADARRAADAAEAHGLLTRLGVAAVFGMQVMMIALALYFGGEEGFEPGHYTFLRWASLVLTVPVLAYSAQPFLRAAGHALRARGLNMDVPVSLAILAAFGGSAWHTVSGDGEVYFDSVVMFVAFLLTSRWLELRARVRAATRLESLAAVVPDVACRIVDADGATRRETVPALALVAGDRVWVRAGEVLPADGVIETGTSSLDESILTGESTPQARAPGAAVLAGSVNLDAPLTLRVTGVGKHSFAGHLAELVARAAAARPAHDGLAERVARWFVAGVLVIAALTALGWMVADPARAFGATLAVLVVSCPCALAIARPAALAAAHAALLARGIAVLGGGALERLARAREMLFDKTGTLTHGQLRVARVEAFAGVAQDDVLALACALAEGSEHPLARALRALPTHTSLPTLQDVSAVAGGGVAGRHGTAAVAFGSRAFVSAQMPDVEFPGSAVDSGGKEAWLARDGTIIGRIEFADALRDEAPVAVAALREAGLGCGILSGDREPAVAAIATACGIDDARAAQNPADKLAEVARRQAAGSVVAMVGDGINDSAVMARADVSIAVADASAPARQQADVLLLAPSLAGIPVTVHVARRLERTIAQNLAWAVGYNLLAVPLAVAGLLPPWAAALGMSASSLVVVANALRIRAPAS
ncbi:MAG: heavy metal translocating P-type ATPase [Gammaproteobacteria bacterium]